MRRRRVRRRAQHEAPTVNLTPLIDVVFVVLIMFIILAPMLEVDDVQLAGSHPAAQSQQITVSDEHPVQIHVYSDNSVRLNKAVMTLEALPLALADLYERHPRAIPLVFHDHRAQFGTYQTVKNAVESSGFSEMQVVLAPGGG